ncbi:hypothetical protein HDV01_005762 [Terramyces sp. JEL0728]|nr:hypothetical protein HDV01_005762 [Terramyces sp. JEL0728]
MLKSVVKKVVSVEQSEGVGARVRRSIGTSELRNLDPFLMLDEFKLAKQGQGEPPAGFPDHPHRGFETVTYMLEGVFDHEDFAGHRGTIHPGDVQWMTAGKGIVHAEIPHTLPCLGLQLWLNLPAKDKMMNPRYQELKSADIPVAEKDGVKVKVIAGNSFGIDAKIDTKSPIYYLDVNMQPHKSFIQTVPANWTIFIYTLNGAGKFGKEKVESEAHATLVFSKEGDQVQVESGDEPLRFALIAGEPIGEPIVQHGPFVMNTREQIVQAMQDYQLGRNGFERAGKWRSEIAHQFR